MLAPFGLLVVEPVGQLGLSCSLLGHGASFAFGPLSWRRFIELSIQPQPRDQFDRLLESLTALHQENGGIAAVTDQDNLSLRLPATNPTDEMGRPLHNRPVFALQPCRRLGRTSRHSQKGTSPRTLTPGHRDHQGHHDPAQAQHVVHLAYAGTHRVSKPTLVLDLASLSRFDGLVHQDAPTTHLAAQRPGSTGPTGYDSIPVATRRLDSVPGDRSRKPDSLPVPWLAGRW